MSFHPEEKLTIGQTLYAYTQGSAYAEFAEGWKGKLAPGYAADFVVLDRDLTAIAAARNSGDQGAADGGGRRRPCMRASSL